MITRNDDNDDNIDKDEMMMIKMKGVMTMMIKKYGEIREQMDDDDRCCYVR